MSLPMRRPGFRYAMTLTRTTPTSPKLASQLREEMASDEGMPPPRRPMSEVEAYLIHMSQPDLRKRNPQIPPRLFGTIRKKGYGKTEGTLHRLKRKRKISTVYIPKAKRKKKLRPRN